MRVTERAQHAVLNAKREAGRLGHDRVGTEHLLLGLLGDEQCLAVATLGGLGVAPETVRPSLPDWWPAEGRVRLANPAEVPVTRYRCRGTQIPTPWTSTTQAPA